MPITSLSLLLHVGCLQPKIAETADDTGSFDSQTASTAADVQQGLIGDGEGVVLAEVVVTTPMTSEGSGFYVQDPGGGEWSGMYIFTETMSGVFTPLVGDKISITGTVSEFYDFTEVKVSSAESIQVIGEEDVVAVEIGSVSDWEPYESVLVSLSDQQVVSAINSYGEVNLSSGIAMDNIFYDFDTEYGASYDAVVGAVSYSFEEFKIGPRSDDDLQGYVPGEAAEASSVADIQQNGVVGAASVEGVVVTAVGDEG